MKYIMLFIAHLVNEVEDLYIYSKCYDVARKTYPVSINKEWLKKGRCGGRSCNRGYSGAGSCFSCPFYQKKD